MFDIICPHCNNQLKHSAILNFNCPICTGILPIPQDINVFALLGLSVQFDLQLSDVKKASLEKLRLLHPDKFSAQNSLSKEIATKNAALVNRAVNILSNEVSRAEYIMSLMQFAYENSENNLPPELLMSYMTIQEELEQADNVDDVHKIAMSTQSELQDNYAMLKVAFDQEDFEKAALLLMQRKFMLRIQNNFNNKLMSL